MEQNKKLMLLALTEEDDGNNLCDDSSDGILKLILLLLNQLGQRQEGVWIPDYVEMVVSRFDDRLFKSHFRLPTESFELLYQRLAPPSSLVKRNFGDTPMVPIDKQLLIFYGMLHRRNHSEQFPTDSMLQNQ